MQSLRVSEPALWSDDGIMFLDDASVELVEEPPVRGSPADELDNAVTRVWIRPYAALPVTRPLGRYRGLRPR
jgi:hypothetical protein